MGDIRQLGNGYVKDGDVVIDKVKYDNLVARVSMLEELVKEMVNALDIANDNEGDTEIWGMNWELM